MIVAWPNYTFIRKLKFVENVSEDFFSRCEIIPVVIVASLTIAEIYHRLSQIRHDCKFLFLHTGIDYSNYSWSGIAIKDALGVQEIMQLREIWEIAWAVIPDFSRNGLYNLLIFLKLKLLTWLSEMCISYFRWSKSINSPYMIAATVKNSNCCVYIQLFEGASELHHFDVRSQLFRWPRIEELLL